MAADEFLRLVVETLEREEIAYALAGSIAAMTYGEPRATLDLDVVVRLAPADVTRLERAFPFPDFYLDRGQAIRATESGGQFNMIHPSGGMKVDFFVVGDAIEESQIRNRVRKLALPDLEADFSPPEELILKKLSYFSMGGSDKHLRDIAAMLRISANSIDVARVEALAEEHGLADIWAEIRSVLDVDDS